MVYSIRAVWENTALAFPEIVVTVARRARGQGDVGVVIKA